MRRSLPLLLLGLTGLAGCHAPGLYGPGPDDYSPSLYGSGWHTQPLRASLWFDEFTGFASFDVNKPAHVAMFALHPGGGMQMIYPAIGFGGRQQFTGGSHHIRTSATSYRFASNYSLAGGASPTYIILIASERPLDVRSFMATGSVPWLSRLAVTWNPYTATEVLASQIVPQPSVTDWTVAYHVIWPDGQWGRPNYQASYVWVMCPGNVILSVPVEAVRRGLVYCPTGEAPSDDTGDARLPKIGDQILKRTPPGWMAPPETSPAEMRETLRRVAERRGVPADEELEVPLPSWRRVTGERPERADEGDEATRRRVPTRPATPEQSILPAVAPERPARPQEVGTRRGPEGRPVIPVVQRRPPEAGERSPRAAPSRAHPQSRVEPRSRPSQPRVQRPAPRPRAEPASKPRPKPKPKPKEGGGGDPS